MKVLHVNHYESPGKRFTGLSVAPILAKYGVTSKSMVWERDRKGGEIIEFSGEHRGKITAMHARVERATSMQSVLFNNVEYILDSEAFREADLVHLHIIHSGYISLMDLPRITQKPCIWTLHDPWALTGHCIHPLECNNWQNGCGNCPDLERLFPMRSDNTNLMFHYKKHYYSKAKFEVIVASKWMKGMALKSPLLENKLVHELPFGVDIKFFEQANGQSFRRQHNIEPSDIVIAFRAEYEFKGLQYIKAALNSINSSRRICLLTFATIGLTDELKDKFRIIEMGWINDEIILRDALDSADIFLMPSTADSFGLMAVEAMACGKAIICFEGTAIPKIVNSPDVGIAVKSRDVDELREAILHLVENPAEREERGSRGKQLVAQNYDEESHAERIAQLYRNVVERRQAENR